MARLLSITVWLHECQGNSVKTLKAKINLNCVQLFSSYRAVANIKSMAVVKTKEIKVVCSEIPVKLTNTFWCCEPDRSDGIATGYGLEGPVIESRWRRDFPHLSRPTLGPIQPHVQWIPCLSRDKDRQERDADPSPPSSAVVKKE